MNRRTLLGGVALVACAIGLVAALRWLAAPSIASHERTVAVLAFTAGTPAQRTAQADSLRARLMQTLAALPGLQVVGGDRPLDSAMLMLRPREVGATLGARLVVSGTIDASGQLAVQLIEVEVGDELYRESVAMVGDHATIAAQLARGIANALRIGGPAGSPTAGPAPPRQPD